MTRAEKELCVFLSLVFTCWGLTDSIQAPFYPIEAASKGATPAQYGLVFGIIHLAIFISSPLFGHYLPRLSLRAVLGFGLVGTSSCACAFGLLPFLPTTAAFLIASYSLRIVEGISEGAAWSSALTLMANVFGKRSPWVFSLAQVHCFTVLGKPSYKKNGKKKRTMSVRGGEEGSTSVHSFYPNFTRPSNHLEMDYAH